MNTPLKHIPTAINLHQKSRLLVVEFDDGQRFEFPCEYLRVFSKAAEVRTMEEPVVGKESVNITAVEPQGHYAVRLVFDDGHETGIYSWDTLYQLGMQQEQNWQAYLQQLQTFGYQRQVQSGPKKVRVLYFAHLATKLRRESETIELPAKIANVADFLELLGRRKHGTAPLFAADQIRVTVNRQFAEPFTLLEDGDEIGLVPTSPNLAPTPDLI
jgi:DUF971 family protein/molybdopterin converting factor small subunit